MAPRRVIVHAGFHKTGSTSAQRYLLGNGKAIWPRCALVMPGKLRQGAAKMAVRYSRFESATLLEQFTEHLTATLREIDPGEKRTILISDENLAGRMPGRDDQADYHAAPTLMAQAEKAIKNVFGGDADVIFHFNTRDPKTWLRSTYRHNLLHSRLVLDWDEYAINVSPDLQNTINTIAAAVSGRVQSAALEKLTGPWGPAQPLIELINLPAHRLDQLLPHPTENRGPPENVVADLLALNRSNLPDTALPAAKSRLMKGQIDG